MSRLQCGLHHTGQVVADGVQVDPSFSRAANAAVVVSASYLARLNRRSTSRCTRRRTGLNRAAAASVAAATATGEESRSTCVASSTSPA